MAFKIQVLKIQHHQTRKYYKNKNIPIRTGVYEDAVKKAKTASKINTILRDCDKRQSFIRNLKRNMGQKLMVNLVPTSKYLSNQPMALYIH